MALDHPSVLAVRARRTLARPAARRAVAVAVAAATGLTVAVQVRSVEAARARWSDTRPVAIARHDLRPGELLDGDDAEVRELPVAAVAGTALTEVPIGVVVRYPIAAGEPLVAERLGAEGLTGVAALLPEGHRAVTVAVGPAGMPPVGVGDTVDVVAVVPTEADLHGHGPGLATGGEGDDGAEDGWSSPPAFPLVERATVVDVGEDAVTLAVPRADAPAVASAALQGTVVLTLAGA